MAAVMILLLMTMVAAGGLALILIMFRPAEGVEVEVEVRREADVYGREELVLTHRGGDRLSDAFRLHGGEIVWRDLEVRVDGVKVVVRSGATLNGRSSVGVVDFLPDNSLRFRVGRGSLYPGRWVEVIYEDQALLRSKI